MHLRPRGWRRSGEVLAGTILASVILIVVLLVSASAEEAKVPAGLDYPAMAQVGQHDEAVSAAVEATAVEAFAVPASSVATASGAISPASSYETKPEVQAEVEDSLVAAAHQPGGDQALRDLLADGRLLDRFQRRLAGYGYSITNLPDVMATYYVTLWEVVNDADAMQQPTGVAAVRQQVGGAFSNSTALQQLADEEKARMAQGMAMTAALAESAHEQMAAAGDSDGLAELRDSVHAAALQQGLDLKRLKLTTEGFVAD